MQYQYLVHYINEYNYIFNIILSKSHDPLFLIEVSNKTKATVDKKYPVFKIFKNLSKKQMRFEQKLKNLVKDNFFSVNLRLGWSLICT